MITAQQAFNYSKESFNNKLLEEILNEIDYLITKEAKQTKQKITIQIDLSKFKSDNLDYIENHVKAIKKTLEEHDFKVKYSIDPDISFWDVIIGTVNYYISWEHINN